MKLANVMLMMVGLFAAFGAAQSAVLQLRVKCDNPELQDQYLVPLSDSRGTYTYVLPRAHDPFQLIDAAAVEYKSKVPKYGFLDYDSGMIPGLQFSLDEEDKQPGFTFNNDKFWTANGSTSWYACRTEALPITLTYPVVAHFKEVPVTKEEWSCEEIQIWYNKIEE